LEATEFEVPDQTITIGLDLPCVLTGIDTPLTQFPFLHQSMLMGGNDRLIQFQQSISSFRDMIRTDWTRFKRLLVYYRNRNWKQFDTQWGKIFEDTAPLPKNEIERHDFFHQAFEMFFISILSEFDYPILKVEFNLFITKLSVEKSEELKDFVFFQTTNKELSQYQSSLFERLSFVVENFSALSPGFPVLFYNATGKQGLSNLRIMRDDFELLKTHYLSCFEICHKVLNIVVGLQNIIARGNPDIFKNGTPVTLRKFSILPNAQKMDIIDSAIFPKMYSRWSSCFNRKLRNSIGHNSIYHDLGTGMLVIDGTPSIPYVEFVASTLNLTSLVLYCVHVIKMMYISRHLLK
jgi:hypothetical protein